MAFLKKNEPEKDNEMGDDNIFAKVPIRPLIAANCTDFVVAHSNTVLRPIRQVSELFMMPKILEVMNKLGLNKLLRVQSHAWGHLIIDRGHGAMVVAAPRSGRTFSYIPPVCDVVGRTILDVKDKATDRLPGYALSGALALILVPDLERVRRVNALCYAFLRNVSHSKTYTLTLTVPTVPKPEFFHRLFSGVGCLVATPALLVSALENHGKEMHFKHLKVIVYDDIDLMDPEMLGKADRVIKKMMPLFRIHPQLVMISQKYDPFQMAKLKLLNRNPALIFGDLLEAAVYGEMRLQIALRPEQDKVKEVLNMLQQRPPKDYRTVVFCSDDADMRRLVGLLEEEHLYSCLPYYQDANLDVGEQVHRWVADARGIILLATDNCPELSIRHAHTLIHYSMSSSWGKFKMRHLAIAGNLINKLDRDPSRRQNGLQLHSLVLLDDTNQMQLPRLVDFVRKFQHVDNAIVAVAKQIRQKMAGLESNHNVVCRQIMMRGDCISTVCEERHHADHRDRPTGSVPTSGDLKVRLVCAYSPTHFCVHIVEHLPPGESWKTFPSLAAQQMRLQLMQGNSNERYWPPVAGAVCLYRIGANKVRVRVLKVEPIKNVNLSVNNLDVLVQAMDEDTRIFSVKSGRLYKCPEELQAEPPMAIDLRVFGMVPYSGERDWWEEDRRDIEYKLKSLREDCFLQAGIEFSTSHTIFIRNLMIISYASAMRTHVQRLNLYHHLTMARLAKSCQQAKNKIQAFFEDAIKTVVEPIVPGQSKNNPQDGQKVQVEEQLKEETKENDPPNKPILSGRAFDVIKLGLEQVRLDRKAKEQQLKEEQEAKEIQAKNLEQTPKQAAEQPEPKKNNESVKQLMQCLNNLAALQIEDALEMPDEDHKQMLKGASKLLDHMENGPGTSQGQPKKSSKRKYANHLADFKVTPPRDPKCHLQLPPNVVRPPTTYYQTRTTLELHVLLPDESFEYTALLSENHVMFNATQRSSEIRHQFVFPMGIPYSSLKHYMRGRTVYISVKKTVAMQDPLSFVQHHNFLKPNHDKFDQKDEDPEQQVEKFTTHEEKMAYWAAKYHEMENGGNSADEDLDIDGVERVDKYEQYED